MSVNWGTVGRSGGSVRSAVWFVVLLAAAASRLRRTGESRARPGGHSACCLPNCRQDPCRRCRGLGRARLAAACPEEHLCGAE